MASWDKARDGCSCGKHGASVLEVVITTHGHADLHAHQRKIRHARAHTHLQTLIHMYMYTLTLALTTYICCHSSRQQYKEGRQECCSFSCKEKKKKVNLGRWQWGRLSDWFIAFSPCQTSSRACACVWCSPLLLLLPTPHMREDKKTQSILLLNMFLRKTLGWRRHENCVCELIGMLGEKCNISCWRLFTTLPGDVVHLSFDVFGSREP